MKFFWCFIVVVLAFACITSARSVDHHQVVDDNCDRPDNQGRVLLGAAIVKKLVLLKFKKIVPISMILLKLNNINKAELVPVYPSVDIPSDVQFLPTPEGILGHTDVQAIAVPNEFHNELEQYGLSDQDGIESLLMQAEENEDGDSYLTVAEDDEQLLERAVTRNTFKKSDSSNRRLPIESKRSSLKNQTAIKEIPIYLYSTRYNGHVVRHNISAKSLDLQ